MILIRPYMHTLIWPTERVVTQQLRSGTRLLPAINQRSGRVNEGDARYWGFYENRFYYMKISPQMLNVSEGLITLGFLSALSPVADSERNELNFIPPVLFWKCSYLARRIVLWVNSIRDSLTSLFMSLFHRWYRTITQSSHSIFDRLSWQSTLVTLEGRPVCTK